MMSVLPQLTNPKPIRTDGVSRSCWYRFYAMFSERFAEEVFTAANLPAGSSVLDPWLGVGTTTAVAARAGMRAVGVDINPAMVTVSNGRSIDRSAAEVAVKKALQGARRTKPTALPKSDPLIEWFAPSAATAIRDWQRHVLSLYPQEQNPQESGFLLTALFEAAWQLAAPYRTKNPTWVKKPARQDRADCTTRKLSELVLEQAQKKVAGCHPTRSGTPAISLGTSTRLGLPAAQVDFVLTSPPYCTRIDYAVSTRIELAVLGYDDAAVSELRDATMGTSTIRRAKAVPTKGWGPICADLLTIIREHPSKSSASYYYKTFLQYFADLFASLGELNRCMKPGASAVIVVQDSRYKGTRVDLAGIVTEMATSMRWALSRREDYEVMQNMRRVNTRSRQYRADANSVETVLWFTTPYGG